MLVTHLDPVPQKLRSHDWLSPQSHLSNKCPIGCSSPPVLLQPVCVPESRNSPSDLQPLQGSQERKGRGGSRGLRGCHGDSPPPSLWGEALSLCASSQGLEGSKLSWAGRRQRGGKRTLVTGEGGKEKEGWGTGRGALGQGQPEQRASPSRCWGRQPSARGQGGMRAGAEADRA